MSIEFVELQDSENYEVRRDGKGNYLFPLHPNSLGAYIVSQAERSDIAASALWMWNFPLKRT